jgi:hypothetical protein
MPTGQAEDEIEDDTAPAPAVTGAAAGPGRRYGADAGPGRRFKPAAPPRDLQDALAPLEDDESGSKIFENLGVQDITPEHVKSVGDLLVLRSYFLTHLGPRLGWLIKLSVTEWSTLSAEEKRVHTAMRRTFLKSYVFGAEAIIQHWFWKTLKTATKSFGPLLSVFSQDYDVSAACGTLAWERIFTAFPCAGTAITHQLIVSGFQHCMSLHGDTTEEFTKYMARLNESLAQLSTVKPLALSEIYALGALIGLHQSGSSRHERAYRELLTYINEGNALTLDEVLKTGLRYSRDHHSAAQAFRAVHDDAAVCNHACPLCCKRDFRGRETPRSSRSRSSPRSTTSSRAGSPQPRRSTTSSRAGSPPPRRALSAAAAQDAWGPINSYWQSQGLAHRYHTYAATLKENFISPHQVILDADIDHLSHPEAGPALMSRASQFLPEPFSDADE